MSVTEDASAQYVPIMNCIFTAQKNVSRRLALVSLHRAELFHHTLDFPNTEHPDRCLQDFWTGCCVPAAGLPSHERIILQNPAPSWSSSIPHCALLLVSRSGRMFTICLDRRWPSCLDPRRASISLSRRRIKSTFGRRASATARSSISAMSARCACRVSIRSTLFALDPPGSSLNPLQSSARLSPFARLAGSFAFVLRLGALVDLVSPLYSTKFPMATLKRLGFGAKPPGASNGAARPKKRKVVGGTPASGTGTPTPGPATPA